MALPGQAADDAGDVTAQLGQIFDEMSGTAERLRDAMRYATMNGGKRMRGCLVLASARMVAQNVNGAKASPVPEATASAGQRNEMAALGQKSGDANAAPRPQAVLGKSVNIANATDATDATDARGTPWWHPPCRGRPGVSPRLLAHS